MAIKKETSALAEKLADSFKIGKDGAGEVKGDPYVANLPEGLTEEVVGKVHDYNSAFIAGSALAFGQAAVDAMSGNKKLDSANITFSMVGKDSVTHTVQRSREARNPTNGETIVKLGAMTTVHEVHGSSQKVGQLGAVRSHVGQLAAEKLAKA